MLRSGGTHRASSSFKDSKELHCHDRVPPNSHTSVHLANYTEKSLLVLKNYVFMEKNQTQSSHVFGGQGDAFMSEDMNGGESIDIPTELWENAKVIKRSEKTISKKKASGKPRSWLPNGGGIKPYNGALRAMAPEECIIDVRAVKPKVDSWFRVKPKPSTKVTPQDIQQVAKTRKVAGQPQKMNIVRMQRAATTMAKHHVRAERAEENGKDKSVKNLTSFWNDHLQKHPLSVAQQKSPTTDAGKRSPGEPSKPKSRHRQMSGRPKSVGSDGVIQEHTLQPSKILSEKKKLSSVEDILVFARLSGSRKSEGDVPITGKQQVVNGKRRSETTKPSNDNSLKKSVSPQKNTKTKPSHTTTHQKSTPPVRRPRRRDHPKFVVRLHPRWILALRVLTLSFRPLMDTWRRKCCPQVSSVLLKSADDDIHHTEQTSCLMNGKTIKETLATSVKRCSERFGKLKLLARQGMSDTLRILTDNKQLRRVGVASTYEPYAVVRLPQPLHALVRPRVRSDRMPLITEPTAFGAVAGTRHLKMASVEVLPRGVRVMLYIEYHLVFSFITVQTVLLVIVLFIRWLQEYTM